MAGGILQLAAYGSQDSYLSGNPQITYFKIVYRRHTNFSMEPIIQRFNGNPTQSLTLETIYKCKVNRNADLMFDTYFVFNLPPIYSTSAPDVIQLLEYEADNKKSWEFNWVKSIGNAIIDNVQITIGGQLIDKQYGDWLNIWSEISLTSEKKEAYNKLIGNVQELYNPSLNKGNLNKVFNNQPTQGAYSFAGPPNVSVPSQPNKYNSNITDNIPYFTESSSDYIYTPNICPQGQADPRITIDAPYWYNKPPDQPAYPSSMYEENKIKKIIRPSIPGKTIYVPLFFWYCRNSGLAIPLIAIQYHEIEIQVTIKPIYDLYTVLLPVATDNDFKQNPPTSNELAEFLPKTKIDEATNQKLNASFPSAPLIRTRPNGYMNINPANIGSFISDNADIEANQIVNNWDMNAHLLINYIFLDDDERRKFALTSHEYLIEQVQRTTSSGLQGFETIDLPFQHPVKEIIWTFQRDDISDRNQWFNYSNWKNEEIAPWNLAWYNDLWGNYVNGINFKYENINNENLASYYKNILIEGKLQFNGIDRMDNMDSYYYSDLQLFKYHSGAPKNGGIYVYSFAIDPENHQPSGTCNFSRINKVTFSCELRSPPLTNLNVDLNKANDYTYNGTFYAVNYNILKIMGGMCGLGFAN